MAETIFNAVAGSNTTAIAKLDSNTNSTNDILADALTSNTTRFFSGTGSSYTGTVPNGNYKYGTFMVNIRYGTKTVLAQSANNDIAINTYDGSSWTGWQELATKSGTWNNFTTAASSGITFYNDTVSTSGYIVRGGFCFVNVSMAVDSAVGDTSKAVITGLPASLKNTIKPPPWTSFANNNVQAESLHQNNTLYIRNAQHLASGRWNISYVYPVA